MEQNKEQNPVINQELTETPMSQNQSEVGPEGRPIMSFGEAVRTCLRKYIDFTGRARRSEYWWFVLFTFILSAVCSFLDAILKVVTHVEFLDNAASLLVFLPCLAVTFRRLHDIGRSGWWAGASYILFAVSVIIVLFMTGFEYNLLTDGETLYHTLSASEKVIALLPLLVGMVVCFIVFVFSLRDSQCEENKYGPSPKYQ